MALNLVLNRICKGDLRIFFIRKSLRAKLTAFAVMVLVGFLALTHITIADFDGHQGAGQLNDIWGSVRVDSLEYDGL